MVLNESEALEVLRPRLANFRSEPYSSLISRIDAEPITETIQVGEVMYQLGFLFVWDNRRGGNVRVIGMVDDGGIRAYHPLSDDFIKAPNEEFVGE